MHKDRPPWAPAPRQKHKSVQSRAVAHRHHCPKGVGLIGEFHGMLRKKKSRRLRRLFFLHLVIAERGGILKKRETSHTRMPLLTNLLLYRKTGQGEWVVNRALGLLEYRADQMIDGRLFPKVPSLRATSRQGYLGHTWTSDL
jgi:hypothetical protein